MTNPTKSPRRAQYLFMRSPYGAFWLSAALAFAGFVALVTSRTSFEGWVGFGSFILFLASTGGLYTEIAMKRRMVTLWFNNPPPRRAGYLFMRTPQGGQNAAIIGMVVSCLIVLIGGVLAGSRVALCSGMQMFFVTAVMLYRLLPNPAPKPSQLRKATSKARQPQRTINPPHLFASDADRADLQKVLNYALYEGRLTPEQFGDRFDRSSQARTYGQLAKLTKELPYQRASELPCRRLAKDERLTLLIVVPVMVAVYWIMSSLPLGGVGIALLSPILIVGVVLGRMTVRRR